MHRSVREMLRWYGKVFLIIMVLSNLVDSEQKHSNHRYNVSSLLEVLTPQSSDVNNVKTRPDYSFEVEPYFGPRSDDFALDEPDTESYSDTDYSDLVEDSVDVEDLTDTPVNTTKHVYFYKPNTQETGTQFEFENFVTQRNNLKSIQPSTGYEVTTLPFKDTIVEEINSPGEHFEDPESSDKPHFEPLRAHGFRPSNSYNYDRYRPHSTKIAFGKHGPIHYSYNIEHAKNNHEHLSEAIPKEKEGQVLIKVYRGRTRWSGGKSYTPWGYFVAQPSIQSKPEESHSFY